MLIEWIVVGAIVAVTLYFSVRSMFHTAKGERACCAEGEKMGCQLAELIKSHNLPRPTTCNGKPVNGPREVEEFRRRMEARREMAAREKQPKN